MARPQKNNADYFSHDNDMRNDRKIKALRQQYGLESYAIFNMLLEALSESDNLTIPNTQLEIKLLAGDFGIDTEKLNDILKAMNDLELIKMDVSIFCPKLLERLQELFNKREYWRLRKQHDKENQSTPEVFQVENLEKIELSPEKTPQTKPNKTKVNNNKTMDGDIRAGNDIQKLWIKCFSRNPNLLEIEYITPLIEKFGISKIGKALREAGMDNIKALRTLQAHIDENGDYVPFENKSESKNKYTYRELLDKFQSLTPDQRRLEFNNYKFMDGVYERI